MTDGREEELERLMGAMILNAGVLERHIAGFARRASRGKPNAEKINRMQVTDHIVICEEAAKRLPPGLAALASKFFPACHAAFGKRNYYVHGAWVLDCPPDQDYSALTVVHTPRKTKKNPDPETTDKPVDLSELRALGDDFLRLRTELGRFSGHLLP